MSLRWSSDGSPWGTVLDIGCGEGDFVAWLAGEGLPFVVVEIPQEAIARARGCYGEIAGRKEFLVSDIREELRAGRNMTG